VTAKRALIVDDSKSARVVLSRLLEKHDLTVDTTDSAESALLYLREHRPDVIFMDQVMSGMDGLSAVQAIKSDPSTAAIPIMMYTSQDGELYAGEARASGAVGVLPKRMAPADIASALYELRLLPDRRSVPAGDFDQVQLPAVESGTGPVAGVIVRAAPETPEALATPAAIAASAAPLAAADLRSILEPLLQEQGAEFRRFVVASLESMSARVVTEVSAQLGAAVSAALPAPPAPAPAAPEPDVVPPRAPRPVAWIALALLGCLLAIASGIVSWRQHRELGAIGARLEATGRELAAAQSAVAAARQAAVPEAPPAERLAVPYGEAPLWGTRLTALATYLAELEARGFEGTVTVTAAAGDFCLTGNPAEGYGLAPGEMPANRCDVVGNPFDESLKPADREPAALTALIAGVRERTHGAIDVRLEHLGRAQAQGAYPSAPEASAAQWNAAAAGRNYLEFSVAPHPTSP
jgi:CheY-like chemotaxis protein